MNINPDYKKLSWFISLLISVDTLIQSSNNRYTFRIHKDKPHDVLNLTIQEKLSKNIVFEKECVSLREAVLIVESKYNLEYV